MIFSMFYCKKRSKIFLFFILLFLIYISSSCSKQSNYYKVICDLDDYSSYSKVVEQVLPSFTVSQSVNKPYYYLNGGSITEAFDTQAIGSLDTGVAKYWYPQYLATVIIAVDRDKTDAIVKSWDDLLPAKQEVAFSNTPGNIQMLIGAISYGLEGENYSLKKATKLLNSLRKGNNLQINSFDSPIIICFDYQAIELINSGRNIEIIIPTQGTLTYEKGLLSNENLEFHGDINQLLLQSNLRLLNGETDNPLYPTKKEYSLAVRVSDYNHFAKIASGTIKVIDRDVLQSKKYMSIDNLEHLLAALIFIMIVTIWVATIIRRSMQKGVGYAALFAGIILNGWTMVRLIKYQVEVTPVLTRYLWYAFYIFQLLLPLVMLWMAWAIDKTENKIIPPKWWRALAVLIGILIILVFTNDLHGFVFKLDLSRDDWAINYTYGFGYYTILFVCMANLIVTLIILMKKSINNPRKLGFLFPLVLFILFGVYNYKYIVRNPLVYETDLTIITGLFALLMFEASIRSGLIPVNTKYIDLFKRSPLKMQIINNEGEVALASIISTPLNKSVQEKLLASSPEPIMENDSLLFANPIPGGYAIWHEDISKLNRLHLEISKSAKMLTEANAILSEEENKKRDLSEKNSKKQLMEKLELEITKSLKKLSEMIENLPISKNQAKETTRIAILLCYIKRRCNLFFKEKEKNNIDADEFIIYIDELSQIAKSSDVKIATVNKVNSNIAIRHATLFYDLFYAIIDLVVITSSNYIILNIEVEDEYLIMRFLLSEDIGEFEPESKLTEAVKNAKGKLIIKQLDDTIGISILFSEGENIND